MPDNQPPENVIEQAKRICQNRLLEYIFSGQPWPEDEWITLNDQWDLNLHDDASGKKLAYVYPVRRSGSTEPYPVFFG